MAEEQGTAESFKTLFGDEGVQNSAPVVAGPPSSDYVDPTVAWAAAKKEPWIGWEVDTKFMFEYWFPMIKDLTFPSVMFDLSSLTLRLSVHYLTNLT